MTAVSAVFTINSHCIQLKLFLYLSNNLPINQYYVDKNQTTLLLLSTVLNQRDTLVLDSKINSVKPFFVSQTSFLTDVENVHLMFHY